MNTRKLKKIKTEADREEDIQRAALKMVIVFGKRIPSDDPLRFLQAEAFMRELFNELDLSPPTQGEIDAVLLHAIKEIEGRSV